MFEISESMLKYRAAGRRHKSAQDNEHVAVFYHVVVPPEFGKLQYRYESFYETIAAPNSYINSFTQKDINEGILSDHKNVTRCCSHFLSLISNACCCWL
jgi:hypothetical protein